MRCATITRPITGTVTDQSDATTYSPENSARREKLGPWRLRPAENLSAVSGSKNESFSLSPTAMAAAVGGGGPSGASGTVLATFVLAKLERSSAVGTALVSSSATAGASAPDVAAREDSAVG
ncbi:hypothetical protein AC629_08715 [Bradyrhizobium sp. NAS80.1]|nr:hypothetical protein AC629_08715 [Bradyrhizobium sp. NAS80.1]